jgi:hypothetical protein
MDSYLVLLAFICIKGILGGTVKCFVLLVKGPVSGIHVRSFWSRDAETQRKIGKGNPVLFEIAVIILAGH